MMLRVTAAKVFFFSFYRTVGFWFGFVASFALVLVWNLPWKFIAICTDTTFHCLLLSLNKLSIHPYVRYRVYFDVVGINRGGVGWGCLTWLLSWTPTTSTILDCGAGRSMIPMTTSLPHSSHSCLWRKIVRSCSWSFQLRRLGSVALRGSSTPNTRIEDHHLCCWTSFSWHF